MERDEPKDTHASFWIDGDAARTLYDAIKSDPLPVDRDGGPDSVKQAGGSSVSSGGEGVGLRRGAS
jgi:hypothetical protein